MRVCIIMLWLILVVSSIEGYVVYQKMFADDEVVFGFLIGTFVVSLFIFFIVLCEGSTDYPDLKQKQAKAQSLHKRIESIRGAKYPYKKDGVLVAGSIENVKQSQTLSYFISEVASAESRYNQRLAKVKAFKGEPIFWWIGTGAFISNKVLELQSL